MSTYYHTEESVHEYIKLSKDINGSNLIKKLKPFLPDRSMLLEIGSGPGSDYKILRNNYQVIGSDMSIIFLDHLKSTFPDGEFLALNAITLNIDRTFNGIYSNKVLHHLVDDELVKSINRQHAVLNSDGIICHSFWAGQGDESFKGMFVNYHDEKSITHYFSSRFEVLVLERYAEFEENDSLLLIGKKID